MSLDIYHGSVPVWFELSVTKKRKHHDSYSFSEIIMLQWLGIIWLALCTVLTLQSEISSVQDPTTDRTSPTVPNAQATIQPPASNFVTTTISSLHNSTVKETANPLPTSVSATDGHRPSSSELVTSYVPETITPSIVFNIVINPVVTTVTDTPTATQSVPRRGSPDESQNSDPTQGHFGYGGILIYGTFFLAVISYVAYKKYKNGTRQPRLSINIQLQPGAIAGPDILAQPGAVIPPAAVVQLLAAQPVAAQNVAAQPVAVASLQPSGVANAQSDSNVALGDAAPPYSPSPSYHSAQPDSDDATESMGPGNLEAAKNDEDPNVTVGVDI
jgi:hypothetical protein